MCGTLHKPPMARSLTKNDGLRRPKNKGKDCFAEFFLSVVEGLVMILYPNFPNSL
jgi:hypothetical protein